jgi:GT2 family glycosyltransferase
MPEEKLKDPIVDIIILNWNGWEDTIECLDSIYRISYPNYEVIVVDNGSKNESIEKIKKYCRDKICTNSKLIQNPSEQNNKPIEIIEYTKKELELVKKRETKNQSFSRKLIMIKNEKNMGFAEGNNIAMRYALKALNPDYILLLNNDTVVDKEFLNEALDVAKSDEKIGIVGPKVYYYCLKGRKDIINFAGGKLDMWKGHAYHIGWNEADKGQYDKIQKVDYVEGSALLVKRDVIEKIGLIDKNYFAYWEEIDFCTRAYNEGYYSVYVPRSKIWHKISSSVKNTTKIYYITRNKFLFMKKYSNNIQYLSFFIYFFFFQFWIQSATYLLVDKNMSSFSYFVKGILNGIHRSADKPSTQP